MGTNSIADAFAHNEENIEIKSDMAFSRGYGWKIPICTNCRCEPLCRMIFNLQKNIVRKWHTLKCPESLRIFIKLGLTNNFTQNYKSIL